MCREFLFFGRRRCTYALDGRVTMQNLVDFHKEFSLHVCRELGFDEAIQHLFAFLLRYIPADRVC